ncbi:hypothetical protein HYV57_05590 [Candidatus Peregrinibacteria bacterium]|nr:hypothetical protein [Candidatus Peregrinibacteria bacterium]
MSPAFAPLILENCRGFRERTHKLLEQLENLDSKGFLKDANDLAEIRRIHQLVQEEIDAIFRQISVPIRANTDLCFCDANMPDSTSKPCHDDVWENIPSLVCDVITDGQTSASCNTALFYTPWSNSFVHGSDSLLAVTELIRHLLQPSEAIHLMRRFTWRKPLQSNLTLSASSHDNKAPSLFKKTRNIVKNRLGTQHPIPNAQDIALDGEFVTNQGRIIRVVGRLNNNAITNTTHRNPFAHNTLCNCPNCCQRPSSDVYSFALHPPTAEGCFDTFAQSSPVSLSTLVEILTIALSHIRLDSAESTVLRLLGGVNNLELPSNMSDLFKDDSRLEVKLNTPHTRLGKSGLQIIPFTYQFSHQSQPASGIIACTTSDEITSRHLCE